MAERRMFAKTIIDSDSFLDMPISSQALYFHLSMRADDDGFINNPKKIQRMIAGTTEDDLKLLIAKNFIIPFESGIVVIKHWRIHNYIRSDRYKETVYQEEKDLLELKENGAYTLGIPNVYQVGDNLDTQVRLGKDSIGKVSLGKDRTGKDNDNRQAVVYFPNDEKLNDTFIDFINMRKKIKAPMTDRAIELAISNLNKLSNGDNDMAVEILNQSIMNSWKGLFPLKDNNFKGGKNNGGSINWDEV